MKYNVGDKVRITTDKSKAFGWNSEGHMDKWLGKAMTIRCVRGDFYLMEEDISENLGMGWVWSDDMIDGLATKEPKHQITITSDGKITTAVFTVDGREVKKGVAKCSPEDKFSFKVGAELALERMWGKAEPTKCVCKHSEQKEMVHHPKHYQGKYECIDMMIVMFGVEAVKHFCMCNSFKYRFRAEQKNGEEDIRKAEWYENMMMELESGIYFEKMNAENLERRKEFYRERDWEKRV